MTATAEKSGGSGVAAPLVRETVTIAAVPSVWSPFSLMDRLDADALAKEMQGIASDVLVYRIKESGKKEETVGLSKAGIDECCTMLVQQGMVIREESITHTIIGDGDNREAFFQCVAARYAVDPSTGREVRLDQVIGTKREPLFEARAPLTLHSRVPGKRWRTAGHDGGPLTYGEAIDPAHDVNQPTERDPQGAAVSYLHWIVEASSFDDATKQFVAAILSGVGVEEFEAGKRFNDFWFEHGAMKAARNARFRLIPAELRAKVIALAKQTGREMAAEVEQGNAPSNQSGRRGAAAAPAKGSAKIIPERRREPKRPPYAWIFSPHVGVAIDTKTSPGSGAGQDYVIDDNTLQKALQFAERGLSGQEVRKGDGTRGVLDEDERATVQKLKDAIDYELNARVEHQALGGDTKRDDAAIEGDLANETAATNEGDTKQES